MGIRRGARIVLTLIGLAIIVSFLAMLAAFFLVGREPGVAKNSTLILRVRGTLAEVEPSGVISQFLVSPPTVRSLVDSLRKAKVDSRVTGVVLMPAGVSSLWGTIQEVRDAVIDFKRSGKPIVAYLEYGGDQEYYLASACDRVFLTPSSPLDVNGLATYEVFLRGTLDKIGAYPDMLHIGDYKTAANTLTERTFTPAHREMTESLNDDMFEQLIRGIADGRKKSEAAVRALMDEGPFLPEDAVRVGLVDDLAYEDQLDDKVKFSTSGEIRRLEGDDYQHVSPGSVGLNTGPKIAVIYAVGTISSGQSSFDGTEGPVLGSDTLIKYLRTARADEDVKAIVLRVDSPGGSAVASDIIWREVLLTRNRKPLIASMSDLAASGGYYIAMPAHAIVAQPGTLTGSIGVVMGKIVTGGTMEKIGVNVESVSRGRNADIYSPVRPFSAEERVKMEEQMQATYDQFVEKAAQARHTTPERIDAVAQGRVWTGRQGKQVGLVDELGGLTRAIGLAKQRAKIAVDQEVEIVVYPPRKSFYEIVSNPFASTGTYLVSRLFSTGESRAIASLTAPLRLFRRGEPLALMPNIFLQN